MKQLSSVKHLILDMDGVLWHGNTPLPKLPEFFKKLKALGIKAVFATNNATKTPDQYIEKFGNFGVTITADQVMTSAVATGLYLSRHYTAAETAVYVIGKDGIRQALSSHGFTILDNRDERTPADLVVVGFNPDVVYEDFAVGTIQARRHGAKLIATNPDATYPSERGLVPGAGSLVAFMRTATDQEPLTVGKPYPTMFEQALVLLGEGATAENTAMVGDRINTDIAGGDAANLITCLVMSGVTQPAQLEASELKPDFIFEDISDLVGQLEAAQ